MLRPASSTNKPAEDCAGALCRVVGMSHTDSARQGRFRGFQDAKAFNTAWRFLAITARYARVVASGFLRPCSHSCSVLGLMQKVRASCACDIRALVRMR